MVWASRIFSAGNERFVSASSLSDSGCSRIALSEAEEEKGCDVGIDSDGDLWGHSVYAECFPGGFRAVSLFEGMSVVWFFVLLAMSFGIATMLRMLCGRRRINQDENEKKTVGNTL